MPPESSRTAEKKQEHIDAIKERIAEDIGPVIEESIQRSADFPVTRAAPNGNDESQAEPQQAIEKFKSLIPRPTFDDVWTERDEQSLTQEAERDVEFQHRCTYQDYISGTWKTAYKFMGCLATDIVGPKSYLVFHDDHATSKTRFWATRFCRKLSSLIIQPVFAANPEKLALAIQWTVICRTGDRRKWCLSGCNDDDKFLRILKEVVEQSQDGAESPQTLRLMALRLFKTRYPARGGDDPLWCQFLQRIEEQALANASAAEQERDSQDFGDFELYRVSTTDLTNLLDAIREVRVCGFPMFHDPTTVAMTVLYARDTADLPLRPQIMEATRAVLLSHRREAKRAQKLSMLENRGSLAPPRPGGAQHGVDEEQGLGAPLNTGLNLPGELLDETVAVTNIARDNLEVHAEGMKGQDVQAAPEMDQTAQEAARRTPSGDIENTGEDAQPEEARPAPRSPTREMPGRPQLDEPETGVDAQDHQDNGQAAQQGRNIARDRRRMEINVKQDKDRRRYAIYRAERFAVSDESDDELQRDSGGRRGREGQQGRDERQGRDGHQNPGTAPNNPNEQQVVRAEQQVLGKRPREKDDVEPSGMTMMPFLRSDEYTLNRNTSGAITGVKSTEPRTDESRMVDVTRIPFGGAGLIFQTEPLTQRGSDMMAELLRGAALNSSTGRVRGILAPAEDFGLGNNLERVGVSAVGQRADILPMNLLQGQDQNQNRPQNQIQNRPQNQFQNRPQNQFQNGPQNQFQNGPQNQFQNGPQNQFQGQYQPTKCILCNSRLHPTGQCPIPTSFHHGDTAVCGPHNTTNKYPHRGHIFDCSGTKPHLTCGDVTNAQNRITRHDNTEKEHWEFLIKWLVVERQRKAPIRVEHSTLDFVGLVLDYSALYCDGQMPPQVDYRWPYTKAEARRYENSLRRYDELGPEGMPKGMLDGKLLGEIRAMRDRGEIPLQVYGPNDPPATNPGV